MSDDRKFNPDNPPPPLMTGEPNSFAHRTMTTRIPKIVQDVINDHAGRYPPEISRALQALRAEIVEARPVQPLITAAPDGESWANAWRPYQGRTWLDLPWYFAEAFFYRRLLEAVHYFGDSEGAQSEAGELKPWVGVDPFLPRKQAELQSEAPWQALAVAMGQAPTNSPAGFRALLHHCVWGNRIDLSYTQVAEASGRQITLATEQANLLVDDTGAVLSHLQPARPGGHLDFICDNTGTELLLDLVLADFLLRFDWASQVTLHVKAHPTFVSDAIPADVDLTLASLKRRPETGPQALARRLQTYQKEARLRVQPDFFWNSPYFFWEIPPALRAQLAHARLVIIKGDANYRRLLGDSRWPTTVPAADAIPYFPAPFVALRTMKSDPVVGLKPGQAEALDAEDPEWRVNGRRGMIQAVLKKR